MIQVIRAYLRKDHANTFIKRTIKKKATYQRANKRKTRAIPFNNKTVYKWSLLRATVAQLS